MALIMLYELRLFTIRVSRRAELYPTLDGAFQPNAACQTSQYLVHFSNSRTLRNPALPLNRIH